ncbi:ABC transporter ATP-binding protein [Psychrobium sp. 1_MG-2023]|uniref:ABC transporter ATP-binding protein n=1 Tax=Psychrobium sp. 1_MG-2023 TaxID=3062624 RepID=UPI000C34CD7A|nr:ABC transporter ATP-binding protein [Psychrobium sp. 1_MG-2023]MDP2562754.1 ABC transporter ATP-binding protein [Psychrobium sp. 1_MG-2023]PKF57683.1 ABC transporter ATP-binding protein [Alteromonadales bacterium alter-6D02]
MSEQVAEQKDIIIVKNLIKRVEVNNGQLEILKSISLNVKQGQSIAIVGASGSGKSTLLGLLAGLDSSTFGEIWLDNAPLHELDEEQRTHLRAEKVGFIFQSFLLLPALTALENVMLPAQLAGHKDAEQQALALLKKVGLDHRDDHYPNQLSGGEQQRVAIARAFICQPKILFADEPTGNLDGDNGHRIERLLFELNEQHHTTLVLVTHDPKLAANCQRIITMSDGTISEQQTTNSQEELTHVV